MHAAHAYTEDAIQCFGEEMTKNAFAFWGNLFRGAVRGGAKVNQAAYQTANKATQAAGRANWQALGAPTTGHQGGFKNMFDIGKRSFSQGRAVQQSTGSVWDGMKGGMQTAQSMMSTMHPDQIRAMRNATIATAGAGATALGAGAAFVR